MLCLVIPIHPKFLLHMQTNPWQLWLLLIPPGLKQRAGSPPYPSCKEKILSWWRSYATFKMEFSRQGSPWIGPDQVPVWASKWSFIPCWERQDTQDCTSHHSPEEVVWWSTLRPVEWTPSRSKDGQLSCHYWWPQMRADIRWWCKACITCAYVKLVDLRDFQWLLSQSLVLSYWNINLTWLNVATLIL